MTKMLIDKEAVELAIEALKKYSTYEGATAMADKAIDALYQAFAKSTEQEPVAWADDCRIELVNAIHMLSSDFENALYAFRWDTEARKSAEGSIAHARGVAVKWNRNGRTSPPQPQEAATAWDKGYQQGVEDERTSEANIGIAGFNAKVKPARQNPYTQPQEAARQWVGLTDEEVRKICIDCFGGYEQAKAIEAKLKEKNNG